MFDSTHYIERLVVEALEKLDAPLTYTQLKKFVKLKNKDLSEGKANTILKDMIRKRIVYHKGDLIHYRASYPHETQTHDPRKIIAFSIFLRFAELTEDDDYYMASFPSQLVFTTDRTYRITVCMDPDDLNLSMLKECIPMYDLVESNKPVTEIIAGFNLMRDDIREDILPGRDYIFAEFNAQNYMTGDPEITFETVTFNS